MDICTNVIQIKYDPAIFRDEVIELLDEGIRTITITFCDKNITCKAHNFYVILPFLLITIAILIAISVYYYLIKYQAKQKHLLPFHDTKLKEVDINNIN